MVRLRKTRSKKWKLENQRDESVEKLLDKVNVNANDASTAEAFSPTCDAQAMMVDSVDLNDAVAAAAANKQDCEEEEEAAAKKMTGECGENTQKDEEIRKLIKERKKIAKSDKHQWKELSKQIKKCNRDKKRPRTQENTEKKSNIIPKVRNDKGETIASRSGTANVFG